MKKSKTRCMMFQSYIMFINCFNVDVKFYISPPVLKFEKFSVIIRIHTNKFMKINLWNISILLRYLFLFKSTFFFCFSGTRKFDDQEWHFVFRQLVCCLISSYSCANFFFGQKLLWIKLFHNFIYNKCITPTNLV